MLQAAKDVTNWLRSFDMSEVDQASEIVEEVFQEFDPPIKGVLYWHG